MSAPYTAGQQVYDIRGHAYNYIGECAAGHVVEPIYEDDEDEPHYDKPQTHREVFAAPPRQKLAEDLTDITAQVEETRKELKRLHSEVFAASNNRRAVERAVKDDARFADLALWLEGKATHIVETGYGSIKIGTVEEILRSPNRDDDKKLRLLGLFVDPRANAFWTGRSAYSDGSSSQTLCRLASSEDHAKAIAREHIASELRTHGNNYLTSWIREALNYGMEVTPDQRLKLTEEARSNAKRALENARATHERAVRDLANAEAAAIKATGDAA